MIAPPDQHLVLDASGVAIAHGLRYRCHVGHAYSAHTVAHDQTTRVEAALVGRAAQPRGERAAVAAHGGRRRAVRRAAGSAQLHAEVARANEGHADLLRGLMASAPAASEAGAAEG